MLEHSFVHIQGIGIKTEHALWEKGILTWEDYLGAECPVLSNGRDKLVRMNIKETLENRDNIQFFADRFSSSDMWRLFDRFRGRAVYLDIETNGGYIGMDEITVIGLYDGNEVQTFVDGLNLEDFETAICDYDLVITFNGSSFDLPFIKRRFRNISLPCAHIDLRFFLNRLGFRGGLKAVEKEFHLARDSEINGMDGYEAIRLWRAYQHGDQASLDLLIQYNTADIVNLEPLMERGYIMMKKKLLPLK